MLHKKHRMGHRDLKVFFDSTDKKTLHSPNFSVVYRANKKQTRFTCVVSKGVEKLSVQRSKLKRRMREVLRHKTHIGVDAVFRAKSGAGMLTYQGVKDEIESLLDKIAKQK